MSSYREKLDFLLLRERISLAWKLIFVALCGFLVFWGLFLFYMPAQIVEVAGTVLSHQTKTSETSSRNYLVVRLDNGVTVHARVYGHVDYRPNHHVILTETTTRFFGYKRYKFNRYAEAPKETDKFRLQR